MARKVGSPRTARSSQEAKPSSETSDQRPTREPILNKQMAKVEEVMARYRNTLRDLAR